MEKHSSDILPGTSDPTSFNHYNFNSTEGYQSSKYCQQQTKKEAGVRDAESKNSTEFSQQVAAHYNALEKSNLAVRKRSRIYYLRNFNNWIKSVLINECVSSLTLNNSEEEKLKVLDMCCGKGGDVLKWANTDVSHVIFTDIAENSLEECKSRVNEFLSNKYRNRTMKKMTCDFILADCTRVRLKDKYESPTTEFDIVSCQFSFHYCFESLPQAECMIRNAAECLKPGGLFIGTIPDAYEIVKRAKLNKINNKIFSIKMRCKDPYPIFGAKYEFYLEGAVNCPEFLVHFPTFVKLASKYGLKLVKKERFSDLFKRKKDSDNNSIARMKALETYSSSSTDILEIAEYFHAEGAMNSMNVPVVKTISKSEWEVISLYLTFVFQKEDKKNNNCVSNVDF